MKRFIRPLSAVERDSILAAMMLCRGDEAEAAARLEIELPLLKAKLAKYRDEEGIDWLRRTRNATGDNPGSDEAS